MNKQLMMILIIVGLVVGFVFSAGAQPMASEHYRISSSVCSSGGAFLGSADYQLKGTLGQPSPLMDPDYPPSSANYELNPGFWYTLKDTADFCECDLNTDGKCDMLDWFLFGQDWGATNCNDPGVDCECDLNTDGKCDMLDWFLFGQDWGRTDCP